MLTTNNYPRRCRTSGGLTTAINTSTPGVLLTRPKFPLRCYYKPRSILNFSHIENASSFNRPKRFKARKINACQKMDITKKKVPDYTETAYREAVSRLKYLLAESYSPRTSGKLIRDKSLFRRSNLRIHELADDTDDRSVLSDCSKGLPGTLSSRTNVITAAEKLRQPMISEHTDDNQLSPKELSTFIMRQEEYIEQLEQESRYCKDELKNLLEKIREVVAENEALHDKNKTGLLKSFLHELEVNEDKKIDTNVTDIETSPGKKMKIYRGIEGPSIMYESRISELEAQLTQARIELKKAQEDNNKSPIKLSDNSGGTSSPETIAQLDQVMKEKREANLKVEETLRNLQIARERETEAIQKAKRAVESAQQAEFEKSQAESEIRRLKDELDRQREKIREATQDACRRLAEERHQVERRYGQQVEQLSADVATHWDAASKSHLEIEKQRREISDLKRELAQKQAIIDDLKKEMYTKISGLQSDLNQMIAEKDAAEQEIATAKLATERCERQARHEQNRWQTEINSYKQRLERADADILHCRRENLRLSEQIASLEKELNMSKIIHATDTTQLSATPRLENEKDLTTMIMDMETKHEDADDIGAVKLTSSPSKKKRTVKVDLKLKINPKKKSVILNSAKAPLSAQKEMASLQSNIDFLSNKIRDTFDNAKGVTSTIPESSVSIDTEINRNSGNVEGNYPENYSNQPTNQEMQQSNYELENNQNYQDYSGHDQNYPGEYTTEDYRQYEQYDPSIYQNESNQDGQEGQSAGTMYHDNQIDQQHYENYPADYNQQQQQEQQQQQDISEQYVVSNQNENNS